MQYKQLLLYLFFLCSSALSAQNKFEIYGLILDEKNHPISNANVFLVQSKTGTITNSEGKFVVTAYRNDILSVSHVGYETVSTKVNAASGSLKIILKTAINQLSEVVVTTLSAEDILKASVDKIKDNYEQNSFQSNVMYRAEVFDKDTLLYLEETAFNIVKSYKHGFKEKYYLLKNRNFQFSDRAYNLRQIGQFDFVGQASEIFDKAFYRKYKISRLPGTSFDNHSLYVLLAESQNKNDTSHMKIYIDTDDMAFVRFDSYANSGDEVMAQYKKIDEKYYLMNGYSIHVNRKNGTNLPVKATMIMTSISHDLSSYDIEGLLIDKNDILREYATNEQDTMFWREHNALLPDSAVTKAMQQYYRKRLDSVSFKSDILKKEATIQRLYKPHLSLMISSDLGKDFYSMNYNSVSISRFINHSLSQYTRWSLFASAAYYMLSMPLEEVLSEKRLLNISGLNPKINPSIFNQYQASYTYNINETTLNNFKQNNQSDFMRLHTIRNDGHYVKSWMLEEELAKADLSDKNNLADFIKYYFVELALHRISNINNPFAEDKKAFASDAQPLIRDRSRSWVKFLFEPEANYRNHILDADLTSEEYSFMKRSAWFSLINLISPQMIGIKKFKISDKNAFTFSLNYLRIPFGEMFGQNIWLTTNRTQLHGISIKQYKNHEQTSFGLGYKLYDLRLSKSAFVTTTLDYWSQPSEPTFYSNTLRHGFHIEQMFEFQLFYNKYIQSNALSLLVGYDYKTKGYIPQSYFTGNRFDFKAAFKWYF